MLPMHEVCWWHRTAENRLPLRFADLASRYIREIFMKDILLIFWLKCLSFLQMCALRKCWIRKCKWDTQFEIYWPNGLRGWPELGVAVVSICGKWMILKILLVFTAWGCSKWVQQEKILKVSVIFKAWESLLRLRVGPPVSGFASLYFHFFGVTSFISVFSESLHRNLRKFVHWPVDVEVAWINPWISCRWLVRGGGHLLWSSNLPQGQEH